MPLYTIIVEYAGGTYVSQNHASCRDEAVRQWLEDSDPESASSPHIHKNQPDLKASLKDQLTDLELGHSKVVSMFGSVFSESIKRTARFMSSELTRKHVV